MQRQIFLIFIFLLNFFRIFAQDSAPESWFTKDKSTSGSYGSGIDRAYKELLNGLTPKPVVVAVIDSGVEADHEDLKDKMWVNVGEIPNNGIDDDKNGFIDDINGWNFLGSKSGKNYNPDTYEETRVYKTLKDKYEKLDSNKIAKKQKNEYVEYLRLKKSVEKKQQDADAQLNQIEATVTMISTGLDAVNAELGRKALSLETLKEIPQDKGQELAIGVNILMQVLNESSFEGITNIDEIKNKINSELKEAIEGLTSKAKYAYNINYDPRKEIVGDDPENYGDINYGNNDVEGPGAFHGTHVAGIIAASRGNSKGIEGISNSALIMSIRAVPDGDERDKDIANAIRYAVNNGAKVINMSFGKGFSPGKKYVDEAVKYANKHDVLLVHGAGNSAENNDSTNNFPNDRYLQKGLFGPKVASNWIEVGAISWQKEEDLVANFSNYGKNQVDLFAPGVDLKSTTPDQSYKFASGTSMASPVVAGVASVIRAYFPSLSAKEVKEILMESSTKINDEVNMPGKDMKIKFSELSKSGGVIDSYKAIQLAAKKTNTKLNSRA